ncbi:hypothetical protein GCM10010299_44860 [Streptomyces tanashiensis]|nr:hypothetical protein GCM10010299_44860 [Streptomyces tanashiensis]
MTLPGESLEPRGVRAAPPNRDGGTLQARLVIVVRVKITLVIQAATDLQDGAAETAAVFVTRPGGNTP